MGDLLRKAWSKNWVEKEFGMVNKCGYCCKDCVYSKGCRFCCTKQEGVVIVPFDCCDCRYSLYKFKK